MPPQPSDADLNLQKVGRDSGQPLQARLFAEGRMKVVAAK
nr:MAG TPA: hypothetical protein [Caudoviricetes sp.]